jgi:hypothetical protein
MNALYIILKKVKKNNNGSCQVATLHSHLVHAVSGVTQDHSQQRVNLLQRLVVFTSLQEFIINLI